MLEAGDKIATTDGIQGLFRMGEVLQKKGHLDYAIEKYKQVITDSEKIVAINPDSNFELRWAALSLGNICDIYELKEDCGLALAYRNLQNDFLQLMTKQNNTKQESDEEEDDMDEAFAQITTKGSSFISLFKKAHEIFEMATQKPDETPQEMLDRINKQIKKQEDEEYNNAVKKLMEITRKNEEIANKPLIVKMKDWCYDHPYWLLFFTILSLFLAAVVIRIINIYKVDINKYKQRNAEFNAKMAKVMQNRPEL